jgi:hypothetical protein
MGFLSLIKRKPPVRVEATPSTDGKVVPFVTRRTEITVEREWTELVVQPEGATASADEPAAETEAPEDKLAVGPAPEIELPHAKLQLPRTKFQHRSPVMKSTSLSLCKRALGLVLSLGLAISAHALVVTPPTIANNTFPATTAGQTLTQTVTLTLTSASAIKSIMLTPASATSAEYKLNSITGCTVDGVTLNTSGSVCSLSITYTAPLATVPNPPQILYTDASINTTAYGIAPASPTASITYTNTLTFNPARVAVTPASAQTLTATFTLTGFSTAITPTAALHYGLAYTAGAVSCTGSAGSQTCTVPVTFIPNYPGGRKEALFLLNGTTRLATVLVYGVGQAPFAMIQPGVVTNPVLNSPNYQYGSVVDENGTAYIVEQGANTIETITKAGVVGTVPFTGLNSPRAIGIDGAGVLYVADQTPNGSTKTYDTVQGIQGSVPYPSGSFYVQSITAGNTGNLYETDFNSIFTVPVAGPGTASTKTINPSNTQASQLVVDSSEDVFVGGYDINEITSAGVQTQVNTVGAGDGLGVDAAGTLYATRYSTGGVAELPASNYAQSESSLDSGSPLGASLGPDGTLYVGNYSNVDMVDRTQGNLVFGEQYGTTPATQTAQIYNGGNLPLTLSNIAISSNGGFTLGTASSNNCVSGTPIAAGAFCNLVVSFLSPHAGVFSGTVSVTSNSLNNTSTTQSIAFSAFTYGVYVTESPNPLAFGNVAVGSSSSMQVTLTNNGDLYNAGIGGFTSTNAAFTVTPGNCSNVAPGSSCTATITFTPTQGVGYSTTIGFSAGSSGGGANQAGSFTASGTGATSIVTLSPTALNFGTELWNHPTSPQYVTLTNTSYYYTATLSNIASTDGDFTVNANSCGSTLLPGATCQLSATFEPLTYANQSYSGMGSIQVTSSAPGSSPIALTFSLAGNGITYPAGVSATPTSLSFGNQTEYTQSNPQTVYVLNQSSATVNFSGTTISGPFTIYQDGCGFGIPAGYQCTYLVAFYPKTVGTSQTGTLTIPFAGASGSPLTVTLTGNGTAGTPVETLFPSQVNFGTTTVGTPPLVTPVTQTVTLANNGTAPMTNIVITITGTNAADYSETDNCAASSPILPVGSCTITVSFLPSAVGARNASLNVSTNAGNSPQSVPLTGAGVLSVAQLQFTPAQLNLIAGAGGACGSTATTTTATAATLCNINSAAQDYLGNTYLVDTTYNVVYRVDTTGKLTVFAGTPSLTGGYGGDSGPATSATLNGPTAIAADAFGNIFISDPGNQAVREVSGGTITTYVNNAVCFGERQSPGPTPFIAPPGRHSVTTCRANFHPQGLIVDRSGNLFIADPQNNVVYEIPAGQNNSTTVAGIYGTAGYNGDSISATSAQLNGPQDVAVDTAGNLYIADTLNYRVRKVDTSGNITTYAGYGVQGNNEDGYPANVAEINPVGVATNLAGDVYISSGAGGIVRKVDTSGFITTIAGSGTGTIGGPATTAGIANAFLSRVDNSGNLLIPTGLQLLAAGPDGILQFGNQAVNVASNPLNVQLEDTGNNPLSFGTTIATVGGTNASDFTFGSFCGYNLMGGKTCKLGVTFTPGGQGPRSAYLSVPTNANGSPQIVLLQGNGTPGATPTATLTAISFGNQTQNTTSSAMSATLTNTGTVALTISNIAITGTNLTNFALSTGTNACGTSLSAGSSCSIYVTFSPTSVVNYSATLSVTDNATGSPTTSALSGSGIAPAAPTATLSGIAFGNQPEGTTSAALFATLSNTSTTSSLTIGAVSLTGANAANFTVATGGTCGSTLTANTSCTIAVTFSPPGVSTGYTATLNVVTNATGSPQTSTLTGTGTYVKPTVTLLPSPFNFGNITIGQKSAAQVFTLTNTSTAPFPFTQSLSDSTNFAITGTTCTPTLIAGNNCTITVVFQPQSPGPFSAGLNVTDYGDSVTVSATVSGTGTPVPAPVAVLTSSIAFPNTTQNATSAAMTATLTNTGNATLNIGSIVLGGTNAADFAIVATANQCVAGGTLAAGSSCLIAATFTPIGTSSYTATITVTDNSATPTQSSTLTGTGVPAVAADFTLTSNTGAQTVTGGTAALYNLTVSATGGTFAGAVSFSATGLPPGATVSFSPASVSPGSTTASSVMTIQTVPTHAQNRPPAHLPWLPSGVTLAFAIPLLWWRNRSRKGLRLMMAAFVIAVLGAGTLSLTGCGAGFSLPLNPTTYTITVVGTSGATTHSTAVVLTVQ